MNPATCMLNVLTSSGIAGCLSPAVFSIAITTDSHEILPLCHHHAVQYAKSRFEHIESSLAVEIEKAAEKFALVNYLRQSPNSGMYYMRGTNIETGRLVEWWGDDLRFLFGLITIVEYNHDVTLWLVDREDDLYRELYSG